MKIQVLGEGCDKCSKLYENTCEAVKLCGLNVEVEKVEDLMAIVSMGILSVPALVVDGKVLVANRIPKAKAIAEILQKAIS